MQGAGGCRGAPNDGGAEGELGAQSSTTYPLGQAFLGKPSKQSQGRDGTTLGQCHPAAWGTASLALWGRECWLSPRALRCLSPQPFGGRPHCPRVQHGMKPLAAAASWCQPYLPGAARFEAKVPPRQVGGPETGTHPAVERDVTHATQGRIWPMSAQCPAAHQSRRGPMGQTLSSCAAPRGAGDTLACMIPRGPATTLPPAHAPRTAPAHRQHLLPSTGRGTAAGAQQRRAGTRGTGPGRQDSGEVEVSRSALFCQP